ncbi:hypothetical protein FF38_14133 [Lucilia cuprina]|uniref:Uncharacterized protein n=1 Tax=Lucilia cuprina TaxID=7375 RepID=A0A0L0C7H8_LUCCU|nr:hypothetical protein CVS40_8989 [Lucilia cuprina]KNC28212.1 hypothetical protein FF38_14133 [Lucilia cuprina]
MAPKSDPLTCKESFLEENKLFSEIELTEESKPIGKLQDFDLLENEIWLLQCPKGMDVSDLENQKLKIPGRTNINNSEAVSMEFNEGKEQHAFAYCNRKGRYDLRLLPVRGTIVVRDRLKAAETVTIERAEECCPPAKRVPLPSGIRVRHPLLGVHYEDKLELDKAVAKRLQKADEISAQILKESLLQKSKRNNAIASSKTNGKQLQIEISSAEDEEVEFVSEEKLKKKKKNKRKHNESNADANDSDGSSNIKKKKSKKSKKNDETVSKDLQWLQNI